MNFSQQYYNTTTKQNYMIFLKSIKKFQSVGKFGAK